jgi:hypothetical protein
MLAKAEKNSADNIHQRGLFGGLTDFQKKRKLMHTKKEVAKADAAGQKAQRAALRRGVSVEGADNLYWVAFEKSIEQQKRK